MHIKDFDQLSFEYDFLREKLLNSYTLDIKRLNFSAINSSHIGDLFYSCNKIDVSGKLEAFIALYYRYIHDEEGWIFNIDTETTTYTLQYHIIPALRGFNFNFYSSQHIIDSISSSIELIKKGLLSGSVEGKVSHGNVISKNTFLCVQHLKELDAPLEFAFLQKDWDDEIYLYESANQYVLYNRWMIEGTIAITNL